MLKRIGSTLEKMAADRPVLLAFLVFLASAATILPLSFPFYLRYPNDFLVNILSEAHGMVFDLLIIGWFLLWLNKLAERRLMSSRYREEIEDFLGWKSPEATHRIAGNIRRLNRAGVREGLRLTEAHLKGANLAGALLREADLWGANLDGANLATADLRRSSLAGASLEGADMERVVLAGSDMRGTNLRDADMERGDITGVDARGVMLRGADLQYANLSGANLERATLSGANLRGAVLRGADLRRAVLESASLRGAVLEDADLRDAVLDAADLAGVALEGARLPLGDELVEAFRRVRTLNGARLDPEPERILREALPHLFQSRLPRLAATPEDTPQPA